MLIAASVMNSVSGCVLALMDQLDRLCGGAFAMFDVDDLAAPDVEPMLAGHGRDLRSRPNQGRNDDPRLGGFQAAAQRGLVARMNDDRRRRRHFTGRGNEAVIFRMRNVRRSFELRRGHRFVPPSMRALRRRRYPSA
jgi:hypothetical protein